MRASTLKILRAYLLCTIFCLCATTVMCGAVITDSETRAVAESFDRAVVTASRSDEQLSVSVRERNFDLKLPDKTAYIVRALPFPVGNAAAIIMSIAEIVGFYFLHSDICYK